MFMTEQQSKASFQLVSGNTRIRTDFRRVAATWEAGSVHLGMFDSADLAHKATGPTSVALQRAGSQTNQHVANVETVQPRQI